MKTQIIVIHGGETFDTYEEYLKDLLQKELDLARLGMRDWKVNLEEQLGENYTVILPRMPNSLNAKYVEWKIWFDKIVPYVEEEAVFVGHSLGGIFLAKYLAENTTPKRTKALFLVAAPFDDTDCEYSLADFALPVRLRALHDCTGKIFIYHSKDDPIVPILDVYKYQRELPNAVIKIFEDRQHFNQEDFPEIVADIKSL
ncbi:MAG: alpha/beta hydrolase [Minisyncoccota bacterium]